MDSSNVYWTDYNAGAVRKVPKGGGTVTTLANGSNSPSGIATDGINVYWSEQSFPGVVRQVPVNGGTPTIIGYNVNNNGIAIDSTNVYWGEHLFPNQGSIDEVTIGGGTTKYLATGLNNILTLTADGSSVFWLENQVGGAIKQVTTSGNGSVTLASGLADPVALVVDNTSVYWLERVDGNNGTGLLKGVLKTPTVQVTVGTTPSGLSYQVDGVSYTAQQSFVWFQGSSHTISAATQSAGSGGQFLWRSWSDGGAGNHMVAPTFNATYSASFDQQFYLTTTATAGGSISPPSGWYSASSVVPITAQVGSGYAFTGFSGDLNGTSSPQNITMNSGHNVAATFVPITYSVSGQISVISGAGLGGVAFSLNGAPSVVTDSGGNYLVSGLVSGGTYTVTPSLSGFVFLPAALTISDINANQLGQNFVAVQNATPVPLSLTTSGFLYSRATRTYNGTMTVANKTASSINGPIQVLLTGLPSGVTVLGANGSWNGSPYLTLANVTTLNAGASATLNLQFSDPTNASINFTAVAYSGVFSQ